MSFLSRTLGMTAVFFIMAVPAQALSQYHCKVTQVLQQTIRLNDADSPAQDQNSQLDGPSLKLYSGKEFWVSKTTGEITGELNSTGYAVSRVLQQGGADNSFVFFVEGYKGVSQHFIYGKVAQFAIGPTKPFTVMGLGFGNDVLIGNCAEQ